MPWQYLRQDSLGDTCIGDSVSYYVGAISGSRDMLCRVCTKTDLGCE